MANTLTNRNDDWMVNALCRQAGTTHADMWYPEKGANCVATARKAKRICDLCPVQQRCIDYALAYDEQWGIWGGIKFEKTRQKDRKQLRDERGITLIATQQRTDTFLKCLNDRRRNRGAAEKDTA